MKIQLDEGAASVARTTIKCAALVVIMIGWPTIRKTVVIDNTPTIAPKDTPQPIREFARLVEGDWIRIGAEGDHEVYPGDEYEIEPHHKSEGM